MIIDKPLSAQDFLQNTDDIHKINALLNNIADLKTHNEKGSINISISGHWGSGKTSYLNALASYFKEAQGLPVLFFEAWKYKNDENILFTLVNQIKDLQGITQKQKNKIQKFLKPFAVSSLLLADKYLQKNFSISTADITNSFKLLEDNIATVHSKSQQNYKLLSTAITDICSSYKSKASNTNSEIYQQFSVTNELTFKNTFVLIIDDLDRLLPKDSFKIIEELRFYFDIDNVIVLMGINDQILNSHIKQVFHIDENATEKFLEKIFHFNFELSSKMINDIHLRYFEEEEKILIRGVADMVGLLPHRKWVKVLNRITKKSTIPHIQITKELVILAFLKELFYEFELLSREMENIIFDLKQDPNHIAEIIQKKIAFSALEKAKFRSLLSNLGSET